MWDGGKGGNGVREAVMSAADAFRRVMLRPLEPFRRWLLSRQVQVVATWTAMTTWVDHDRKPTGLTSTHVVSFMTDGNGRRWSTVETTSRFGADDHEGILAARTMWRVHGDLPQNARRTDNRPRGQLVVLPGRRGDAA